MGYAADVLADLPVGFWELQEASGTTAADAAASPHNGARVGGAFAAAGPLVDPSKAFDSHAAAGYINVPNTAALQFSGATEITIEFLLKSATATPGNFKHIVSMSDNNGFVGFLVTTGANGLKFGIGDTGAEIAQDFAYTWDTAWHHYVFQLSTVAFGYSFLTVWIDGVSTFAVPLSTVGVTYGITPNTTDPLRFLDWSEDTTNALCFPGYMAYPAIYDHALGATRVGVHWNDVITASTAGAGAQISETDTINAGLAVITAQDMRISDLQEILGAAVDVNDYMVLLDVSDHLMGPTGTDKKIKISELVSALVRLGA